MMDGSWTDALSASLDVSSFYGIDTSLGTNAAGFEFMTPRFMMYRVICEHLEMVGRILDASNCFLQMVNELGEETAMHGERAEWVAGEC